MKHLSLLFLCFFSHFSALRAQSTPFFSDQLVVTVNTLNVRERPNTSSKKVTTLSQGNVVQYLEAWNNGEYVQADTTDPESPYAPWLKVQYEGKSGWVFGNYVTASVGIYYENEFLFDNTPLPPLFWYGVYMRDSFADELRKVSVRLVEQTSEMMEAKVNTIKTNQTEASKFLIASVLPLQTGYCGPLGAFDLNQYYVSRSLGPGGQFSIHPGADYNDTIPKISYNLAATGCATLEGEYVQVRDYKLTLFNFETQPAQIQDLTAWVKPELPEISPVVEIMWFGDLDRDNKPDMVIQDCPYEMGCRASLFLSSKARKGEFIRKVSEHFWPGD